jgi:hypothetical protein
MADTGDMTTTASIVFSSFTSAADPMPRAWSRFRDQLVVSEHQPVDAQDSPPSEPVCVWRLLASNNRELGRSAALYPSFDDARAAVFDTRLMQNVEIRSVHGPNAGTHGWFVQEPDAQPLMTCGRWYGAHAASMDAARHSIEAFRRAAVVDEVHRLLSPDRRRSVRETAAAPTGGASPSEPVIRLIS